MTPRDLTAIADAATFLFVPGNRPERFAKAIASDADAVIVDLEDAVCADERLRARAQIRDWWSTHPPAKQLLLRVNALDTVDAPADIHLAGQLRGLAGLMVAKAEDPKALGELNEQLPELPIVPLIESALGLSRVGEIAQVAGTCRLAFGHLDFAANLGIAPSGPLTTHARCELVIASRTAGLAPPVDGVTVELDNAQVVHDDTAHSKSLGFGGKLCLHPRQVTPVQDAFAPHKDEIAWARRVLDAARDGAFRVGTEMVDAPVLLRARTILKRAPQHV